MERKEIQADRYAEHSDHLGTTIIKMNGRSLLWNMEGEIIESPFIDPGEITWVPYAAYTLLPPDYSPTKE